MTEENRALLIAEIATAHGIKGQVKLRVFADDETLVERAAIRDAKGKVYNIKITGAVKDAFIASIEGITDRNEAELLRGLKFYIDRADLPETTEDEYYVEDLKGLRAINESGVDIGTVLNVVNYGASDLLDIKPASGGESFYVPLTDDTLIDVDYDAKTITLEIPETA